MNYNCPNNQCLFYQKTNFVIKDGTFRRRSDSRTLQRFRCKHCGKRFSSETLKDEYYQKKRRINHTLFKLLSSGVSMRRSSLILGVDKKTVERRLPYLGKKCQKKNEKLLIRFQQNKVRRLQFDDLITKENSKLKPLSVTLAVDEETRMILACEVSRIPAFGSLAKIARKKYGYRRCEHRGGLRKVFEALRDKVDNNVQIKSDEHKRYPEFVRSYFPESEYQQFKGERAHVAGQGELKKVGFDPLFAINHTAAMLRANINRLIRKTWCTTKDPQMLKYHLEVFIYFYNAFYLRGTNTI